MINEVRRGKISVGIVDGFHGGEGLREILKDRQNRPVEEREAFQMWEEQK